MNNPKLTKQMKQQLLSQRKKKTWYEIFRQRIPSMTLHFDLVFTKNKQSRRDFELILSDFYMRPDYWSALFDTVFSSKDAFQFGTVSASELNPVVASQFSLIPNDILYAGYIDKNFLSGIQVDIFENLRADAGYEAASRFYREYFQRGADDREVLFFWHLILNSVIRDYVDSTNRDVMTRALQDRKRFIERNTSKLQRTIESGVIEDIRMDKVTVPLSQYSLAIMQPEEILMDVTSNWFFEIPVKNRTIYAVGPKYIARNFSDKDYIFRLEGQSVIKARGWIDRMINQKSFNTMFYEDGYFIPATVLLDQKPTKKYTVKTLDRDYAIQYIEQHHSDIPQVSPRGFMYGVGVFDPQNKIVGAAVINTSSAPPKDYPGQYHIVELSRIAIPESHRGEGISGILTSWLLENKEVFNRSNYAEANVVTFSLLRQPGTIYESARTLYPVGLLKPRSRGRVNVLSDEWKIRWESNPLNKKAIREYLPRLHPIFMKAVYGIHAWTGVQTSPTLTRSDFRWKYFGSVAALNDLARIFRINKTTWKSRTSKSFKDYVTDHIAEPNNAKVLKNLLDELIFTINSDTQRRLG